MSETLQCSNCGAYAGTDIHDRIVELEANINLKADFIEKTLNDSAGDYQRIKELEAKLAKAMDALDRITKPVGCWDDIAGLGGSDAGDLRVYARQIYIELKQGEAGE